MLMEQASAKISALKQKRRRTTAICLLLMLISTASGVWAASRVMPLYGKWVYAVREDMHEVAALGSPAYLVIEIQYEGAPPSGIQLLDTGTGRILREAVMQEDPENKTVTLSCDVGAGSYGISLVPADNYELKYKIDAQPSYQHIDNHIAFMKDPGGSLWISVDAGYERALDNRGIRVTINLSGQGYAPIAYDGFIAQGPDDKTGPLEVNLSEIAAYKNYDMPRITTADVVLYAEYEDPADKTAKDVSVKEQIEIKNWPAYDPGQSLFTFNMSATKHYLRSLGSAPKETLKDKTGSTAPGSQSLE